MKIVHKSKEYLLVTHKPIKIPLVLLVCLTVLGYLFIDRLITGKTDELMGLSIGIGTLSIFLYAMTRRAYMKFDARTHIVTYFREDFFKKSNGTFTFEEIVDVINHNIRDTDGTTYRVEIILKNKERIPIVEHSSTVERQEEVAKEIRQWVSL